MDKKIFKKVHIYFTSGTGNSFRVSQWMKEAAQEQGAACTVSSVDKAAPKKDLEKAGQETLVGLVNPTHGFISPWHMLKFAFKMPRNRGRSINAFCAAARAGWFLGPWQLPGIAGLAAFIPALILLLKGYKMRGVMSVNMPTNWLQIHWGMTDKSNEKVFKRSFPLVGQFITGIMEGKSHWFTLNNLWEILWGLCLCWLSLLYLCFGRFFLGKLFFADYNCNGCGLCQRFCSAGGVTVRRKLGNRPYWKIYCEGCMRCMAYCPQKAIQASWAWLIFVIWFSFSSIFVGVFLDLFPGLKGLFHGLPVSIMNAVTVLAAYCILYFFFHLLSRIPFVNRILRITTPTSFWRRYHAPGVKPGDMTGDQKK